jgi:hypothetical protein
MVSGSLPVISEILIRMSESWGGNDTVVLASVEVQYRVVSYGPPLIDPMNRALVQIRTRWRQIGPARAMPVHTSRYAIAASLLPSQRSGSIWATLWHYIWLEGLPSWANMLGQLK